MPKKLQIENGTRYGRLVVLSEGERAGVGKVRTMNCVCDCGNEINVRLADVRKGYTVSCGCYNKDVLVETKSKLIDGLKSSDHPLYGIWCGIIKRCGNPTANNFQNYGGRGIKVCERWRNSFANFVSDMGERPSGYSIERINNDGNYEPENCKWASRKEQSSNTRIAKKILFKGEYITHSELDRQLGLNPATTCKRAKRGWTEEQMVSRGRWHRGKV